MSDDFHLYFLNKMAQNVSNVTSIRFPFYGMRKFEKNLVSQRGARTHDPEIKSLMLYQLS